MKRRLDPNTLALLLPGTVLGDGLQLVAEWDSSQFEATSESD